MVGASAAQFARIEPVLKHVSPNIFHAGDVGAGHVIKLVNNMISHAQRLLTQEGMTLAARNGLDPDRAAQILLASGGRNAYMNQTSHLPLKLNMAGVIPAIFASSIILFPATAASWFGTGSGTGTRVLQSITQALSPGEPLYLLLYGALIAGFAFFYTAIVFNSQETADNLKKSGALIPGIRPGKATADYIDGVLTRLTAAGAAYLVAVCLLPEFMRSGWNVPFYFGGTSLLIVVVVVMDFTAQIQAHLMSHQYESLLKKANLKGSGRSGLVRR